MKPFDAKPKASFNFDNGNDYKDPKFKLGYYKRMSKYKNIFAKGYVPNWSEEAFVIKKVKNTVPWTYFIEDINGVEIIGIFYEKEFQKRI